MSNIEWVLVERKNMSGRYVALRGLKFKTQEEAEAHKKAIPNQRYAARLLVESRAVKVDDSGKRMHCQCCGRAILANMGSIAHHGYERPGGGWQTSSCYGAKELPWEVDRSAVLRLINFLKQRLENMIKSRKEIADEVADIRWSYSVRDRAFAKPQLKWLDINRGNFEALKAEHAVYFQRASLYDFDKLKNLDLLDRDRKIERIKSDIKEFQARYDGWKQTHKRENGEWVAL